MMNNESSSPTASYAFQLIIYWAIVAVPLTWGVYKTYVKAKLLFGH